MSAPQPIAVRLAKVEPLAPNVRCCIFERVDGEEFSFEAGQYVCLGAELDGEMQKRYYSIASAPSPDPRFELCIKVGSDGFGRFLAEMEPGAELGCEGPGGKMRLRRPGRCDSLFIASGTGVSAMRSMTEHLLGGEQDLTGGRSVTFLLGARTPDDLLYRDRFEQLAAERPNFRFLPTLSAADASWTGLRGRVLDHLSQAIGGPDHLDVYVCGHPEMVAEARRRLAEAGIDEDSVVYEKY